MGKSEAVDERAALTRNTADKGLVEYWEAREVIENPAMRLRAVPYCWHFRDVYPLLERASTIVPMEHAYRRSLLFQNPGLAPRPWITTTLYGGCAWYNPGEIAEVHRHPPSASRFTLHGNGGYTMVEGEKLPMTRGDLVVTPNGTWHDHGNDGKEPIIWIDLLDLPLVENLRNNWAMDYEYRENGEQRRNQSASKPARYSRKLYGTGGVRPRLRSHRRGKGVGSPKFFYPWEDTLKALDEARDVAEDPCDGVAVEFTDPMTGGSVLPTMGFGVQLYKAGAQGAFQRRTSSTFFCVIEGRGRTEIEGGPALEWERNDVFVVPGWHGYRHVNTDPKGEVLLYAVSDEPVVKSLGLWRHQRRAASGEVEELE
jgi:gentisate 1,2-dioxygenase